MKKSKKLYLAGSKWKVRIFLPLIFFITGCTSTRPLSTVENPDRGYYKNHVNSQLIRDQIKEIFESVVRIQNNVIYRTYQFYVEEMPLASEIKGKDLEEISAQSYLDDQSTAGTAVVVSEYRNKYALLTAAHTVFFS